jgi:repressor LexA
MKPLTDRQAGVLAFIANFSLDKGYPPTREEIRAWFGWSSANAAQEHLNALIKKGRIRVEPGKSRALIVLPAEAAA